MYTFFLHNCDHNLKLCQITNFFALVLKPPQPMLPFSVVLHAATFLLPESVHFSFTS